MLVVVGVLLWLLDNYAPMDSKTKTIINVVIVLVVVVWPLQAFGVLGSLPDLRSGRYSRCPGCCGIGLLGGQRLSPTDYVAMVEARAAAISDRWH
jgi:hypothetical protein